MLEAGRLFGGCTGQVFSDHIDRALAVQACLDSGLNCRGCVFSATILAKHVDADSCVAKLRHNVMATLTSARGATGG